MATGNLNIAWNVSGGADGARTAGPITVPTPTAVLETLPVALVNGSVTVNVPAGATWAVIMPPNVTIPGVVPPNPLYGGTITLKGVSGDTGIAIAANFPQVLTFPTATPASFVLTATAAGTATVIFA